MKRDIRVDEINTPSAFTEIKQLWEELADASQYSTVFQIWGWLWEWWKAYGRGRRLLVLIVWEGKKAIGVAPLFLSSSYVGFPFRIIGLLGLGPSDYLDFIYCSGKEEVFFTAIFDYLYKEKHRWDLIDLQQISTSSPTFEFLQQRLWTESFVQDYCLQVNLPANWEEFKKNLSKKMRWNIEYNARRLNREYQLSINDIDESSSFGKEFAIFMSLHRKRWFRKYQPGLFIQPKFRKFHQEVAADLHRKGRLALYSLKLNDEVAASLYGFRYKKRFYYYLGGFNPQLGKLSLGTVLIAHVIRKEIEKGYKCFDFLRGVEEYKLRWGAKPQENWRFFLGKHDKRSGLVARILKQEEEFVQAAKEKVRSK